jgi:ribonuclease HI
VETQPGRREAGQSNPHFLLFSESRCSPPSQCGAGSEGARWRFVLESVDGASRLEAADEESPTDPGRLELLAVVRGLEALDQPSRVTLVTPSRYVSRGLRFGLAQWRENDWQWERFGEMTRIKNWDLWQRIDRALCYHRVECRTWRFDPPDRPLRGMHRSRSGASAGDRGDRRADPEAAEMVAASRCRRVLSACRRALGGVLRRCWPAASQRAELRAA